MPSKCGCVELINDKLKEAYDQRIALATTLGKDELQGKIPIYATRYTDAGNPRKGKAVYANYCPFCGEKWEWDSTLEAQPTTDS